MNFALQTRPSIDLTISPRVHSHIAVKHAMPGGSDLHLVDLTVSYSMANATVTPISAFSMFAPRGSVTALIGRSGTGKTSLLSCAAATLRPSHGKVWLGGVEVSALDGAALDSYRRNSVGVVHQQYNLIQSLSALENVVVPMTLAGVKRKEATEKAEALLKKFDMATYRSHKPGQLSGGQQQRVAVARALANDPALIIADEPTAHLDGASVQDVSDLLRFISAEGRTVLLSTHDDRLLCTADQVITLGSGVSR
jgi:putative ABC transport system ATP-binding protein